MTVLLPPQQPVVLDGGLSTELERRGFDLSGDLWSAQVMTDDPHAVVAVHRSFLEAGARVLTTASYQAPAELLDLSVDLARQAVRDWREATGSTEGVLVAGSVAPYGAHLANGEEYRGDYVEELTAGDLAAWHRPRMVALAEAGADLLALETVPSGAEARVLLALAGELDVPAWLSLTTVTLDDRSGDQQVVTRRGEDAADVFALAADVPSIVAVGANCTDPLEVGAAVRVAAAASGKPVVVYPNSGETWDGAARSWRGRPDLDLSLVRQWLDDGALLVGGCCRVGPAEIAQVAELVRG